MVLSINISFRINTTQTDVRRDIGISRYMTIFQPVLPHYELFTLTLNWLQYS